MLPADCTQLAIIGNYRKFDVQDQFAGEIPVDGVKGANTYLASLMIRHYFGKGWSADFIVPAGTLKVKTQMGDPIYLSGFGDLDLAGAYDFAAIWGAGGYRPSLELRVGMGLPTGTQAKIDNSDGLFPPNLLALGYGTFSLHGTLTFTQSFHRLFAAKLFGQFRQPLSYSEQNIKYGSTLNYGLGVLWRTTTWLSVTAQATGQHMEPNTNLIEGELTSSGGNVLAAELSVSTSFKQRVALGLSGRVPFYANLNNSFTSRQLTETFSVSGFFALMFGGEDEDEDVDEVPETE